MMLRNCLLAHLRPIVQFINGLLALLEMFVEGTFGLPLKVQQLQLLIGLLVLLCKSRLLF